MARLNTSFDHSRVEASNYEPLPPGEYVVQVVNSDIMPTKAGTGEYIKVECDVLDGPHQGRKLFTNFNIANPNPQAVEIGYQQLALLCQAIGLAGELNNTEELHWKPCLAVVKVKPPQNGYDASNEIKGWKPLKTAPRAAAPAPAQAAPQQEATNAPPWRQ